MNIQTLKDMLTNNTMIYTIYTDYIEDERVIYKVNINDFNEIVINRELEKSGYEYDEVTVDACNLESALIDILKDLQIANFKYKLM